MEQYLHTIGSYFFKVLIATGTQLFVLLGPLLVLAFIMHFVAKINEKLSYDVFGRTIYLYGFGWLGTAVHEMGHALFALLFRHKINDMVLFSPNAEAGSLGYVNHSYDKKSIYQNIGNFFIGIGPILLGSLLLFAITYFLYNFNIAKVSVTINADILLNINTFKSTALQIGSGIFNYGSYILKGEHACWWRLLILGYCLYAIGSSITLSPPDIKGAAKGFLFFAIVLFLFNSITLWIGNFTEKAFFTIGSYFSILYFLIILSIVANILFIIILLLMRFIKSLIIT